MLSRPVEEVNKRRETHENKVGFLQSSIFRVMVGHEFILVIVDAMIFIGIESEFPLRMKSLQFWVDFFSLCYAVAVVVVRHGIVDMLSSLNNVCLLVRWSSLRRLLYI